MRVFANHGGTITRAADYPINGYASMVAIGDLTSDGLPDLAVSVPVSPGIAPDSVVILVNRERRRLSPPLTRASNAAVACSVVQSFRHLPLNRAQWASASSRPSLR